MKLTLSKRWYEVRANAEEICLDVAAGASLSRVKKKTTQKQMKTSTPPEPLEDRERHQTNQVKSDTIR